MVPYIIRFLASNQIKRIVFYRIGAIGDIIHTLPLIKLCSEFNPRSTIELIVGSKQVKDLLDKTCNFITNTYVIKHKGIFDKPLKIFPKLDEEEKFLKESFEQRPPDEFIYLHSNQLKAYFLNKRIVNAKKYFVYKRDPELLAVSNYVTTRYPDLREELLENPYYVLKYKTLHAEILRCTQDDGLSDAEYICVVLGVGSLRPHRAYPLLKWVQFIEKVLESSNYQIKILGGPDESELAQEFEAMIARRQEVLKLNYDKKRIENLIGKTSLLELAGILSGAKKVYSADAGILHIASALGCEIESVFSITSEKRFGPFNPKAKVLRSQSCKCKLSSTNIPKHCSNTKAGYAGCIWDIQLSL